MKLISFHNVDQLNNQPKNPSTTPSTLTGLASEQIFAKYDQCFDGIGRISEPYHIKIDANATPVVHPPRKLRATLRERVQTELHDMETKGIIEKTDEPTAWINSTKRDLINSESASTLAI